MTPEQAYRLAKKIYGQRPKYLRLGQWAFSCLYDMLPELANEIRSNDRLDPFHMDSRMAAFEEYIFRASALLSAKE